MPDVHSQRNDEPTSTNATIGTASFLLRACMDMVLIAERPRSGGTRRRLYPEQHGKPSAPLERLVRICVSLRFAILQLCDSAAESFLGEAHCRCQVTTEGFTWQVHCEQDSRSDSEINYRSTPHDLNQSIQSSLMNSDLGSSAEMLGFNVACALRFDHRVQHSIN